MEIFSNLKVQTEKDDFHHIQKKHEPNASVSRCGGCVVKCGGCVTYCAEEKQTPKQVFKNRISR